MDYSYITKVGWLETFWFPQASGITKNALAFAGWNRGYETMLYGNTIFLMHYASGYELSRKYKYLALVISLGHIQR